MIWLLSALAIPTDKNLGNCLLKIDISGAVVPLVWLKAVIFASYLVKPQMCCMTSITLCLEFVSRVHNQITDDVRFYFIKVAPSVLDFFARGF